MIDDLIRSWIESKPGIISGDMPEQVWQNVMREFTEFVGGVHQFSVNDLEQALRRVGYSLDIVRDKYRVALPVAEGVLVDD